MKVGNTRCCVTATLWARGKENRGFGGWLLLFPSGHLAGVRRGLLERSEHRKSLTPIGGQAFCWSEV